MHPFTSVHCLERMGIQIWRQAKQLPGAEQTVAFDAYELYGPLAEACGVLCIERRQVPVAQEAVFSSLLDAMLAAVKLKRTPLTAACPSAKNSLILLMGQALVQQALVSAQPLDSLRADNLRVEANNDRLLVTYHPLDLIAEPANKAKAWEDLKKILTPVIK